MPSLSCAVEQADEVELVAAMGRGDAAALGALYDRHAPQMLALARRIAAIPSAAEDIVQEVFLEAWEKARSYNRARGTVKTWLLLRTRSRSIDFRRAASQSRTSSERVDLSGLADARAVEPSPDRAAVRRALSELPVEQRDALVLGYFEGLSSTEIAERLGAPVGTIKTRVAAGLAKLRASLADAGGANEG